MPIASQTEKALYRVAAEDDAMALMLAGDWGSAARLPASVVLAKQLLAERPGRVVIDGTALTSAHPRVAAFVHALGQRLAERGVSVDQRALPGNVEALMALAVTAPSRPATDNRQANRVAQLGWHAWVRWASVMEVIGLVGQAAASTPRLLTGRVQMRWRDFVDLIRETGAASLPVVTVVNLLIGAVLGFMGAVQLQTFGAGMYLADLVGISVAREMAAIMTAFVMAGRIGATFAAHLATMQANEEVDALRMIGVSPFEFLALPRLAALTLMMPLLYLYAAALGILGGLIVAYIVLGTPPVSFVERLHDAIAMRHFMIGFIKSIFFGVLIALASCHLGLRAGRNAAEVGRAATRTVVVCIIGIIVIDAIFALCTNALGV